MEYRNCDRDRNWRNAPAVDDSRDERSETMDSSVSFIRDSDKDESP